MSNHGEWRRILDPFRDRLSRDLENLNGDMKISPWKHFIGDNKVFM